MQLVEACRVQDSDDTEICILTVTGSYPVTVEAFVMKLRRKRVLRKRFGTANFGSVDSLCYHDRLAKGIARCSTLLPIRGSAGMPSSLSGYLPLMG